MQCGTYQPILDAMLAREDERISVITSPRMFLCINVWIVSLFTIISGNHDAKRLYDNLLRKQKYNKLVRPVERENITLTVKVGLRMSQILEVVSEENV